MVIEFAATIFYPLYPTIEIQTVLSVTFFHKLQNCSHWLILLRRLKYVDFVVFFLFCSQHFTQIFIVISLVLIVIVCCYIFVVKNHLQYLPLACVLKMLFFNQLFAVLLASAIICLLFLVLAIVLRVTFFWARYNAIKYNCKSNLFNYAIEGRKLCFFHFYFDSLPIRWSVLLVREKIIFLTSSLFSAYFN